MKIQHPLIKNYIHTNAPRGSVSQWFAENPDLYAFLGLAGHNGIDIVAPWGTPMYAVEDGIVADVKDTADGYGKHIRILSERSNSEWTFGHCSEIFVEVGQEVKAGHYMANMGRTGFVVSSNDGNGFWKPFSNKYAGTHCHMGRREIEFVKRGGWRYNDKSQRFKVLNYDNGFKGAVNFSHMMTDAEFVADEEILDTPTLIRFLTWLKDLGAFKKLNQV